MNCLKKFLFFIIIGLSLSIIELTLIVNSFIVLGKFFAFREVGIRSRDENITESAIIKPPYEK